MNDLVGRPAPRFELEDISGRRHRLEDLRGDWVLLVFHRHLA